MKGLNKVILIGNVQPKDPELNYTKTGMACCKFKLVTDESYKDDSGKLVDRAEWHRIVAWGKLGEICSTYLKKAAASMQRARSEPETATRRTERPFILRRRYFWTI